MSNDQQQAFVGPRVVFAGAQMRRKPAFGLAEYTLCVPASSVFFRREGSLQRSPVGTARSRLWVSSCVDRNDRFANLPVFAAAAVMLLGVVSAVAEQPSNADPFNGLSHGGQKAWCIVARTATDDRRKNKVAAVIDHRRE